MYEKTIIYKLVSNDLNIKECYVGSTTNFTKRKHDHKRDCNNCDRKAYNQKKYQFIRANGGWDAWCMIEIEKYPCNDNNEARTRERFWFEQLNANLNVKMPIRTEEEYKEYSKIYQHTEQRKEYMENHKEQASERSRIYYETNKEEILQKDKQHYKQNKEQILEYHKQYYEHNKETVDEKNKIYHQNNKEQIDKQRNGTHLCECGIQYTQSNKTRHEKSKKHIAFIASQKL
jgi:hypothetical protein